MRIKKGISVEWERSHSGRMVLRLTKSRGKLTLEEIEETLRYGTLPSGSGFNGHYAILLNCSESTCGGNGLWDTGTSEGDSVDLHEIGDGSECPICTALVPPHEYCPHCGERWDQQYQPNIT